MQFICVSLENLIHPVMHIETGQRLVAEIECVGRAPGLCRSSPAPTMTLDMSLICQHLTELS